MFIGADQRMEDFFRVAPAIKAPLSFTGCPVLSLLENGFGIASSLVGGMKRCDMRSRRICLEHSSLSWLSRDWRRFWRLCWVVLICLSTTAIMVFGVVVCLVARSVAV